MKMSENPESRPPLQPPDDDLQPMGRGRLLFLLLVLFTLFILVDIAILAYWLLPWRGEPATPPAVETSLRTAPAPPGQKEKTGADKTGARAAPRPVPGGAGRPAWPVTGTRVEAAGIVSRGSQWRCCRGRLPGSLLTVWKYSMSSCYCVDSAAET